MKSVNIRDNTKYHQLEEQFAETLEIDSDQTNKSKELVTGQAVVGEEWHHPIPYWTRVYYVCLSCLVTAMLYADQNLTAPNLTAIAEYFGMDETEKDSLVAGTTQFLFFVVGAIFALPIGYFTDVVNRKILLVIVVMLGTGPCILMLAVTEFWQFVLLRVLTGISLGSAPPLIFSLMGDLFIVTQRNYASAAVAGSMGVGTLVGQAIAGFTGPHMSWKVPFVIVALPTILVAIIMLFTMKEIPRGVSEEAIRHCFSSHEDFVYKETPDSMKILQLFQISSNWLIILQSIFGCLPWGMMQTYMNDFLSEDKGLGQTLATTIIEVYGVGLGVGLIVGGVLGQFLYNKQKEYVSVLMGGSVMLGAVPVIILINLNLSSGSVQVWAFFLAFFGGLFASISNPNIRPIVINVNLPEVRGVALAVQTTLDDLGKGLGPAVIGWLAGTLNRELRFTLATLAWIPCGLLQLCLWYTIRKDELNMQYKLQNILEMQETIRVQDSSIEMTEPNQNYPK